MTGEALSVVKAPLAVDRRGRGWGRLRAVLWLALAAPVGWMAAQDVGVDNQQTLALVVLALMLGLLATGLARRCRLLFVVLATFLTWRYLTWRVGGTLPEPLSLSFVPGVLLFAAEIYGIAMLFLGLFVNIRPLDRPPAPLPDDPALLPTVDVMVPTYNESAELIETTLIAARQMSYPAGKLRVFLLDDGGTEQKRGDADPRKAGAALARHNELQELCARTGATYMTRSRNTHAKAGNINAALARTDGDLVVIFDTDHVPTEDFLLRSVGHFLRDPKLFLVQTPHFFINPDPIERNLGTFERMPSENEMFYEVGQRGLDFWGASFFCGSAAVLRRSCLMEIGGIQGTSITEDAETALELHARGYTSAYVARPMVAGLSPETFVGFIGQRSRWAQGMIQILMLKNPLFKRGLSTAQRLCYLSSMIFWLFPLARMLFLLTPLAYLLFGLQIYRASFHEFVAYGLAHLAASLMLTNFQFGRVRWPFISELYEIAQAPFLSRAILSVFIRPRAPTFNVTAKSETLERSFVSHLGRPLLILFGLLLLGAGVGLLRWQHFPLERENLLIVLGWNLFNMLFVLGGLGVVYEQKQRRGMPRVPRSVDAQVRIGGVTVPARIADLSVGGAQLALGQGASLYRDLAYGKATLLVGGGLAGDRDDRRELPVEIRHVVVQDDTMLLGVRFDAATAAERAEVVRLCFGSSDAWVAFQAARRRSRTLAGGFLYFLSLVAMRGTAGLVAVLRDRALLAGGGAESVRTLPVALPQAGRPAALAAKPGIVAGMAALLLATAAGGAPALAAGQELPLLSADAVLHGQDGGLTVPLQLPAALPLGEAVLRLAYSNALAIAPDQSSLEVALNGRPMARLPLDASQGKAEVEVVIPSAAFLAGRNELSFRASQQHRLGCERAAFEELWTRIDHAGSRLAVDATGSAIGPDTLDGLAAASQYDGLALTIATVRPLADAAALRWGAMAAEAMALRRGNRPLPIRAASLSAAATGGTSNPSAAAGDSTVDWRRHGGGNLVVVGTMAELYDILTPAQRASVTDRVFVRALPADPQHFAVIVTGADEPAVDRALAAFRDRAAMLWQREMPLLAGGAAASFADLGLATRELPLGHVGALAVPFALPPDFYAGAGQELLLRLNYAHAAGLAPTSALIIRVNGASANMIRLDRSGGAVVTDRVIPLSMQFLRPGGNTIELEPVLDLAEGAACPGGTPVLSVFDDSRLELPAFARLPLGGDLRAWASAAFPYAGQTDAPAAMVVLGEDAATIGAAWALRGRMAQSFGGPLADLPIGTDLVADGRSLLLIGATAKVPAELALPLPWSRGEAAALVPPVAAADAAAKPAAIDARARWTQRIQAERGVEGDTLVEKLLARLTSRASARAVTPGLVPAPEDRHGGQAAGVVAALRSPYAGERQVTVVTAASPADLAAATDALLSPAIWNRLDGDLARWDGASEAPVTQRLAEPFLIGPLPREAGQLWLAALTFLSRHPPIWVALLLASLVLLSLGTGWALRRRPS